MEATQVSYPHRSNPDGTFDAICPECFRTVATKAREADLLQFEESHVCSQEDLSNLAEFGPS